MSGRDPGDVGPEAVKPASRARLVAITLDDKSISRANPNVVHEREVAIYDIIDANQFALDGRDDGPYALDLSISEDRLVLTVGVLTESCGAEASGAETGGIEAGAPAAVPTFTVVLALSTLRRTIKDYFLVCDTYYQAIRTAPPSRIQAIDMGRRALHDEGSRILAERLKGKITLDHDTARRLFTLICALHWKG